MAFIADERHRQRQAAGKPTKRSQALSASTADNAARRKDQLGKALARRAALGYWRQIPTDAAVELAGMLPPRWQGEDTGDSAVNAISWGSGETAWWIDIAVPPSRYEASRWKEDPHKSVPGGGAIADNKADEEALDMGTEEAAAYYSERWCEGVTPIPAAISQAIMRLLPIRRKKHMIPRELRWELEDLTGYRGPAQLIWDAIRGRAGLMAEREAFEFVPFEGADQQVTDATDDVVDDVGTVSDAVDCEDCDGFGCFVCEDDEPTPRPDTWDIWDGPTAEELDEMRSWFCPDCGMLACVGDCADLYAEPPRQGSRQRRATVITQAVA